MLYVGVDAHKAHSQMTVMDGTGTVLERRRAASSREGMLGALGAHRGGGDEPMKAVLEAGYGWGPLYDWIGEVADEVVLAHPLKQHCPTFADPSQLSDEVPQKESRGWRTRWRTRKSRSCRK